MKVNNFKKNYNHNDWLLFIDDIINFLIVFSSVIDLVIWACLGLKMACIVAFSMLMLIGLGKTIIGMINFFNK